MNFGETIPRGATNRSYIPIAAMESEHTYRYQSYLLRVWREGGNGPWRATLEDAHSGERRAFANLSRLFDFLEQQTDAVETDEEYDIREKEQ